MEERESLIEELSKEIANWEQLQSLYAAEHLEADPLREDAELLLPSQELDEVIRYETHLEDQIERKLRQFYARRREPVLRRAETCRRPARKQWRRSWPANRIGGGVGVWRYRRHAQGKWMTLALKPHAN